MVFTIIILILLFVLCLFLYSWYRIHTAICIRSSEGKKTPEEYGMSFETKQFTTKDGIELAGWYIPVKNPKAFVILVHGYAQFDGGRPLMLFDAEFLHRAGYATLLISLRGTGESEGTKSTFGVTEWKDAEAAYDLVKTLPESKGKKIGFFGVSMGAATVIVTTGLTQKGDFVIAGVPYADFSSLYSYRLRKERLPQFLIPFLLFATAIELGFCYRSFTPDKLITKIRVPVFIIASKRDEIVNYTDALYLYEKANIPKALWKADSGHMVNEDLPEETKKRVLAFLKTCV
jgi:uncharacterized protein